MVCLLIEHLIGNLIDYFRVYDISKNGKIDMNGIKRAPVESLVGNIQFFFACLLIGFAIKHFIENPNIHKLDEVYQNYWIIIDLMIMFLN